MNLALGFWRSDPVRSGSGFKSLLNVEKNMMQIHGLRTVLEDQRIALLRILVWLQNTRIKASPL